jgi:signal transduction histidine kinase
VLRAISWLVRVIAFVLIGLYSFVFVPAGSTSSVLVATGYALSGAALAAWACWDLMPGALGRWTAPDSRPRRHKPPSADAQDAAAGAPAGEPADSRGAALLPILLSVITAASGLTSAGPHSSTLIGLTIMAVVAAGSETGVRTGWVVAAVGVLAVQIGALTYGADRGVFLGYPLVLVVALLVGHNRRAYRVRAEQAALMLEQAEQLRAQQRLTAVLDERTRLAREIHDVLAHSLGALGIQIQAARALVAQGGQEARVDDMLARAQRMAADGLTETRRAVHALRVDSAPLAQALETIAENHRQQHRAPVRVAIISPEPELSPEQNVQLVRTAQEALTNAAKHAPHQPVDITLGYEDHHVTMTVSNPLASGDDEPAEATFTTLDGGYGLTGIRERLLLVGGRLETDVRDGSWTLTARVPR